MKKKKIPDLVKALLIFAGVVALMVVAKIVFKIQ
jgi:hypothetical protein